MLTFSFFFFVGSRSPPPFGASPPAFGASFPLSPPPFGPPPLSPPPFGPPPKVFGIVTDAEKWYFMECSLDDQDRLRFKLSKPLTVVYDSENMGVNVERVLGHIAWSPFALEV